MQAIHYLNTAQTQNCILKYTNITLWLFPKEIINNSILQQGKTVTTTSYFQEIGYIHENFEKEATHTNA